MWVKIETYNQNPMCKNLQSYVQATCNTKEELIVIDSRK